MLARRTLARAARIRIPQSAFSAAVTPDDDAVQVTYHEDGFVDVTMTRPEMHNAFSDRVIKRFSNVFSELRAQSGIRGVFLRSTGKSFCAGADLDWMKRASHYDHEENVEDAVRLSSMLRTLDQLPHPTVAVVQGAAIGGGVGLVSCCDIAIATESANFALAEARLGLTPATISPYVVARIGQRNARRFFLTAERFDAAKAQDIGLIHEVAADEEELEAMAASFRKRISECAPTGVRASKSLIFAVANEPVTSDLIEDTARRLAKQRMSVEGREGVASFLEKRKASWKV